MESRAASAAFWGPSAFPEADGLRIFDPCHFASLRTYPACGCRELTAH
jgi:hypothetical protein